MLRDAALDLAQASRHWHTLGADQGRWADPRGHRELADAFLRYHAAKLVHESLASPDGPARAA